MIAISGEHLTCADIAALAEQRDTCVVTREGDEYPFASIWQGANTGGSYSRRMIDAVQNRNGGQALGRFYVYNRIIERDRFLVWIK
ncbi:NucA/NucB deoxyribonuclease domain-containing protein [Streptomyces sp. NBC_01390]|uniref:NucA/NucB deoxyribonuclease domain-containing protein n=1 Tax=Streptomyces sp. NBC_01390 TaxID=2903850 RepID=UPI0032440BD8